MFETYIAGYIGGASGIFFTHPLDTIKTNMQATGKGIWSSTRTIYQRNGFLSFFAGITPPVCFRGFSFAVNYYTYNKCLSYKCSAAMSGLISGAVMASFETPPVLVKTRAQNREHTKESVIFYLREMRSIIQEEGIAGIFAGNVFRMGIMAAGYAVFYAIYDELKEKGLTPSQAASIAIVPSWTCVYPLEVMAVVKMNVKKKTTWSRRYFTNAWAYRWVQNNRHMSFWRGYEICILRAVIRFPITLLVSEELKERFAPKESE